MKPYLSDADVTLYHGDALDVLRELPDVSVQTCVTSPPYWQLRDYGVAGALGLEDTPEEYVDRLVEVFGEVRRVLRDDGTLWLNIGDSYAAKARGSDVGWTKSRLTNPGTVQKAQAASLRRTGERHRGKRSGLKNKDLVGIPWMLAFALRADGWWLRAENIWHKPNPMPESVKDRTTRAHEQVFLFAKSERYHYDAEAIAEAATWYGPNGQPKSGPHATQMRGRAGRNKQKQAAAAAAAAGNHASERRYDGFNERWDEAVAAGGAALTRNARSVWTILTRQYADAHFAVFPEELPRRCVLAGAPPGGVVLDPFMGSGTTALVARMFERRAIGIDLNSEYLDMAARRLAQQSLFASEQVPA